MTLHVQPAPGTARCWNAWGSSSVIENNGEFFDGKERPSLLALLCLTMAFMLLDVKKKLTFGSVHPMFLLLSLSETETVRA